HVGDVEGGGGAAFGVGVHRVAGLEAAGAALQEVAALVGLRVPPAAEVDVLGGAAVLAVGRPGVAVGAGDVDGGGHWFSLRSSGRTAPPMVTHRLRAWAVV